MRPIATLALVLHLIAPTSSEASSGEGSRFRARWDTRAAIGPAQPEALAAFRLQVDTFSRRVAAQPVVSQQAAPLCMEAATRFQIDENGVIGGTFSLLRPVVFSDGQCSKMTSGGSKIHFNLAAFRMVPVKHERPNGGEWFRVAADRIDTDGFSFIDNGDRYEVMTRPGVPLLRAVTAEAWYRREIEDESARLGEADAEMAAVPSVTHVSFEQWERDELPAIAAEIREQVKQAAAFAPNATLRDELLRSADTTIQARIDGMQAMIAASAAGQSSYADARRGTSDLLARFRAELGALSPAERAQPACATPDGHFAAHATCPPEQTLWELNPGYFDTRHPGAVQLVVLETPSHAYHGENGAMEANRLAIWQSLDRNALRDMIH